MNRIFRWTWFSALVLSFVALTAGLGVWQTQRGQYKQAVLDALTVAATQPPVTLMRGSAAGEYPVRAQASGRYDIVFQLLHDNQAHEQKPGYHVWTPFRLADGGVIMVNRGWLPANPDRRVLPTLPAPDTAQVSGLWRALPQPGLRLAKVVNCPAEKTFPAVVSYPDLEDLRCLLGENVIAGVLLLDAGAPGGFVREWNPRFVGLPPSRHYAYAATWFLLCATLLFLFVRIHLKKSNE